MPDRRGINGNSLGHLGNPRGCPTSVLYFNSTTSTGTSNTDIVQTDFDSQVRVIRAWFVATENSAGDSEDVKLTDTDDNAITDTADYSALSSGDAMEWSNYNQTNNLIGKGENIKIVKTASTAVTSCKVYIEVAKEE